MVTILLSLLMLPHFRPHYFLTQHGFAPIPQSELIDSAPFPILAAGQYPIQVGNLPKLFCDLFPFLQFRHFHQQTFILIPVALLVEIKKVTGLYNLHALVFQQNFQLVEWNQKFIGIGNFSRCFILAPHRILQIEPVLIPEWLCEFQGFKAEGEVPVPENDRPIFLSLPSFLHFLDDGVAVGDGRNEVSLDQEVREDAGEPNSDTFLRPEHVVKAELGRDNVIIGMLYFFVQVELGEISGSCVQFIGLIFCPLLLISLYALLAEVICHHILDSGQSPFLNILSSTASDVQDMQEFILEPLTDVKRLLNFGAHGFCILSNEYRFDPVVEGLEVISFVQHPLCLILFSPGLVVVVLPHANGPVVQLIVMIHGNINYYKRLTSFSNISISRLIVLFDVAKACQLLSLDCTIPVFVTFRVIQIQHTEYLVRIAYRDFLHRPLFL